MPHSEIGQAAKKKGYLTFEGELLLQAAHMARFASVQLPMCTQGQHDETLISVVRATACGLQAIRTRPRLAWRLRRKKNQVQTRLNQNRTLSDTY